MDNKQHKDHYEYIISIIVPVYNTSSYLKKCLYSIANQTLKEKIQLIIVNDSSTDNSLNIINDFIDKLSISNIHIQLISNDKNLGLGPTRNVGVRYATGKYIGFIDSDDRVNYKMFETMIDYAEKYQADMVQCNVLREKSIHNKELLVNHNKDFIVLENKKEALWGSFFEPGGLFFSAWSKIYRRDFWEKYDIEFNNIYMEDALPAIYLAYYADKIVILNVPLYIYKFDGTDSISFQKGLNSIISKFQGYFYTYSQFLLFIIDKNLYACSHASWKKLCAKSSSWLMMDFLVQTNKNEKTECINILFNSFNEYLYIIDIAYPQWLYIYWNSLKKYNLLNEKTKHDIWKTLIKHLDKIPYSLDYLIAKIPDEDKLYLPKKLFSSIRQHISKKNSHHISLTLKNNSVSTKYINKKHIAIFYICTGKYSTFWNDFFKSTELLFLPNSYEYAYEKHYFVFTDSTDLNDCDNPRVHIIKQKALEWPLPTLMRFKFFYSIKDYVQSFFDSAGFDYIYFFNANTELLDIITYKDIHPENNDKYLAFTKHPGYWYNKDPNKLPYDRNPKSKAFIPYGKGAIYVAGGLSGGTSELYWQLIERCNNNIDYDLKNGVIAKWHDESHINRYLLDLQKNTNRDFVVKILHPGFLYPDGYDLPFKPLIRVKDKSSFGGHSFLRGIEPISKPQKKTLIMKIFGGLGNQMFQYAMANALANKFNLDIKYNLEYFKEPQARSLFLETFPNVKLTIADTLDISKASIFSEKTLNYTPIINFNSSKHLIGYWQSELYFKDIENTIRDKFKFKVDENSNETDSYSQNDLDNYNFLKNLKEYKDNRLSSKNINYSLVSIHLRRGDYLKSSDHKICSFDYYAKSVKLIADALSKKSYTPLFLIFSDELDYAKDVINFPYQCIFIDINKQGHHSQNDMMLISRCDHHITANSTFSWWGAWLSANSNKIIITPSNWFNDAKLNLQSKTLCPKSWIRLSNY